MKVKSLIKLKWVEHLKHKNMSKARMATNALKWLFSKPGATKDAPRQMMNALDIAGRLGPDAVFAGMAAAQTPGDLGDKLIVGGTDFLMSGIPGLAAGRATNSGLVDQMASIGGAYASMPVSDMILRGKDKIAGGQGLSPYERLGAEQQVQMRDDITQQVMQAYGLIPGTRDQYFSDPSTGMMVG